MLKKKLKRVRDRAIGRLDHQWYRDRGMIIGDDVWIGDGCDFDPGSPWLITIGDDVVFGPGVRIVAHDAALRRRIGYTKLQHVRIGSHVYVGANALILPGVTIGDNSVVGAGSVVTRSVPPGSLAYGHPARVVSTVDEYEARLRDQLDQGPRYNEDTPGRTLTPAERARMRVEIPQDGWGWGV